MRIAVPQAAKVYPLDRNPRTFAFAAEQANVGPIGRTQVWSYTVPSARAFLLNTALLSQIVVSPGNLNAYGFIDIDIDFIIVFNNYILADARGNNRFVNIPVNTPLLSGQVLSANWFIQGAATISQTLIAVGVEYDR
jgi:hypothetical protein